MAFRDSLRELLDAIARPQRLVQPGPGGVLAGLNQRAVEEELLSVVPEDEQVPDDVRGLPGLRGAFERGEEKASEKKG